MLVMLRDFGHNALKSGFIMHEGDKLSTEPIGTMLSRMPVVFKSSKAVVAAADLERFVVLHVVKPRLIRRSLIILSGKNIRAANKKHG